ncbi:MAG TPA: NAD(P)/FAD-dependent oxidoreductase [Phycisphaerae bacterium]|nr:NAD(P)/FAD-dependent oxidoreductase [Phycisphaerae bacterium]
MHYETVIIGAGMSGLAAGIRLAYFGKRVCIVERHSAFGGLNSFYRLGGREFDVGLHAVTNFVGPEVRSAPLPRLLRQLRLSRDAFQLRPQRFSEIRFPGCRLRFSNDIGLLIGEVADRFPDQADGFRRLVAEIREYDDLQPDVTYRSAREVLGTYLSDPLLIEMLLCPLMYYGSAQEGDMDYTALATLFKAILCEGLARPRGGVRTLIRVLVKKYRECGGELRMKCGVQRLEVDGGGVSALVLSDGETITADAVLSSAGFTETMRLCSDAEAVLATGEAGRLSFVESISCLDTTPADLGLGAAVLFYNDAERFTYARPDGPVDVSSGVICCPNNFDDHEDLPEGLIRVTSLANPDYWDGLDEAAYRAAKQECYGRVLDRAARFVPEFRDHVVFKDIFTPRTIRHYTGHVNGAVYGAPAKVRSGRTRLKNLFICGTDQGFVGIIGAMLSGIAMANLHVLQGE